MNKGKKIIDSIVKCVEEVKGFILVAVVIVAVLGGIVGHRYYRYTQDEPQYCASCHLMKEAFSGMAERKTPVTLYARHAIN